MIFIESETIELKSSVVVALLQRVGRFPMMLARTGSADCPLSFESEFLFS